MEINYCRRCGSKARVVAAHVYKCENKHTLFANPAPTAGVFFIDENNRVMLAIRGVEPEKGMLDAFGGFLDGEETLEASLARELHEELGLEPSEYTQPTYLTSGVGHYRFNGEVTPIITTLFWARLLTNRTLKPQDDVAGIYVTHISDIDLNKLHDDDIKLGIKKLRSIFLS